jgi:Arc/MetJ family transcription regulator
MPRGFLADFESPEWKLSLTAVKIDEPLFMSETISMTAADNLEAFYHQALRAAVRYNATLVLQQLIDLGVSVHDLIGSEVAGNGKTNTATIELLLENGWDINARGKINADSEPFKWRVVESYDMVRWCLDCGASVRPCGQEPLRLDSITQSQRACEQILEKVAAWGSVETFELLRSKGAPLGWRPLHRAVETATYYPPSDERPSTYQDRMDMVRHLIEVVKIDVNAPDRPKGASSALGTPICYIPASAMLDTDTRELTWLLLDAGADPGQALELARTECERFVKVVEAWRRERGGWKCCVQ